MAKNINNNFAQYGVFEHMNIEFKCDHCDEIHRQNVPLNYYVLFNRERKDLQSTFKWLERKMIVANTEKTTFEVSMGIEMVFPPMCMS